MKFKFTFLALIIVSIQAYSQSKNTISVQYGSTSNAVDILGAIGDFGFKGQGGMTLGLNYTRDLGHSLSLETGLMYSYDKVQLNTIQPGRDLLINGDIKLLTVPIIAKYTFFRYLFLDAGLLADFETNYAGKSGNEANSEATRQTGMGFELGIGGKYTFSNVTIFINPFIQDHAVTRYNGGNGSNFTLFDSGFKFGLGYSF